MWLTVLLVIVVCLLAFAWWLGVFYKIEISEDQFPGGTYVYMDWKDDIKNINTPWIKINQDLTKSGSSVTANFMGIYYDDPGNL